MQPGRCHLFGLRLLAASFEDDDGRKSKKGIGRDLGFASRARKDTEPY
jgi:hypothetical protein